MNAIAKARYSFGKYDRVIINGDTYRWLKFSKTSGKHLFQRVTENVEEQLVAEDDCLTYTDQEIHVLHRRKVLKIDELYYSKALAELRLRQDNTDLSGLTEEEVRTLFWKREWCVRLNRARAGLDGYAIRPTLNHDDLETFIDLIKDEMALWYFRRYGEHRKPGRLLKRVLEDGTEVVERKPHDFPGPTALRNWMRLYRLSDQRLEAFVDGYHKCGYRPQLHPEVDDIVNRCVKAYPSLNRPTRDHIFEDIEVKLRDLNQHRSKEQQLSVSATTVNRRIRKLNPFLVEAGRMGIDQAIRSFAPAGQGVETLDFMQRIEIDDWTVDLFALICKHEKWLTMTKKQRDAVPRIRATVTVAIDCATRCIVGLNISEATPTTAGAKAAVMSMLIDKDGIARMANCMSDWPMQGKPGQVVSDGGAVFKEEFERAVLQVRSNRILPDIDPRMRGYVEAVNKTLKAFCRYFTGQSFANVVEKGDYQAEAYASLDFETFRAAFIQFVVDKYHRRPHRGLGGMSPYAQWEMLTGGRREIPIDEVKRIVVFGFQQPGVRLDKHGVQNLNISYWSQETSVLFTLLGHSGRVTIHIDPSDVGRVLVAVPKAHRQALRDMMVRYEYEANPASTDQFLMVPSTDTSLHGKSLVEYAEERAELRAAARIAQEKDKAFRLHAHESLSLTSRRQSLAAGIPDHHMTQRMWENLANIVRQKARAATPKSEQDVEGTEADNDQFGTFTVKARASGRRRSRSKIQAPQQAKTAALPAQPHLPAPASDNDLEDFGIEDINAVGDDQE